MSDIVSKSQMKRLGALDPARLTEDFFRIKAERDRYRKIIDKLLVSAVHWEVCSFRTQGTKCDCIVRDAREAVFPDVADGGKDD